MPAYNSSSFIKEAIESVISQTFTNWELIIINDGSTDNTEDIISQYKEKNRKIKSIRLNKNNGVSIARNQGLSIARGQFIAFLDSDDVWLKQKLEIQLSIFHKKKEISFLFSSYRKMSSNGKKISKIIPAQPTINKNQLLKRNKIPLVTVVLNRLHIKTVQFHENMKTAEDYYLWLNILEQVPYAYGINKDLARYRLVKKSASNKYSKSLFGVMYIHFFLEYEGIFIACYRLIHHLINGFSKLLLYPICEEPSNKSNKIQLPTT